MTTQEQLDMAFVRLSTAETSLRIATLRLRRGRRLIEDLQRQIAPPTSLQEGRASAPEDKIDESAKS